MQAILNVALPIFGTILAGWLAGRWRILGGESTAALNAFVSYFALPVLFFGSLARAPVTAVLDPLLIAGLSLTVLATFGLGGGELLLCGFEYPAPELGLQGLHRVLIINERYVHL